MNSKKVIFVHLQKCGGTSVESSISPYCKWNDVLIGSTRLGEIMQWEYFAQFGLHKHSSAKEIIAIIGSPNWEEFFSWTVVRNPFSRICSLYNFTQSLVARHAKEVAFPTDGTLEEQRIWSNRDDYPQTEPWSFPAVRAYLQCVNSDHRFSTFLRSDLLATDGAFDPQWWGLQHEKGDNLAVNQFVKLENLNEEWPALCEKMGIENVDLKIENETDPRFAKSPIELFRYSEDVELIKERFRSDFSAFGYDPNVLP
jgi:hypothetical protein